MQIITMDTAAAAGEKSEMFYSYLYAMVLTEHSSNHTAYEGLLCS